MRTRLTALSLLLILAILFSACAAPAPPAAGSAADSATTAPAEAEEARGVLRIPHPIPYGGKESMDPASPVEFTLAVLSVYDRLVRLDENGAAAPSLATSWTSNEEATEWTFALRDDVTFHDGQPFTSADAAYTIQHILDPDLQSPLASTLALITDIQTPDPQTVVFTLDQGHADFPLLLTNRLAAVIPADSGDTIGQTGIGTGPFKLESLNPEGVTVLSANDAYWNGKPGLKGIELYGLADAEARTLAMQSDQIDFLFDATAAQVELFAGNDAFVLLRFPSGNWDTLIMRTDTPPFDDPRVRRAMRLVADRQAMIDLVLSGEGTVSCDTPVSPADVYRWEGDCPQDIAQARQLLADAGYADGLDVTLFTSNIFPQLIPLAEVYQQQAAAAGINVTLEVAPPDKYWTDVWLVEPFVTSSWLERPADQILNIAWRSTSPWNESYFQNEAFDQLLDETRQTLDFDARRDLYQAAQRQIAEKGGNLIPYHTNRAYILSAAVSGFPARDFQHIEWHRITKSE